MPFVVKFLQPTDHGFPRELPLLIWSQQFAFTALGTNDFSEVDEQPCTIVLKPVLGKGELAFQCTGEILPCLPYPAKRNALLAESGNDGDLNQLHVGQRFAVMAWRQCTSRPLVPLDDGLWCDSRVTRHFL